MTSEDSQQMRREIVEECAQALELEARKMEKGAELCLTLPERPRSKTSRADMSLELKVVGSILQFAADHLRQEFGLVPRPDDGLSPQKRAQIEQLLKKHVSQ